MFDKVLLALDLDDEKMVDRLVPMAETMARDNGAELHVLAVVPSYSMPIVGSYFPENFEAEMVDRVALALKAAIDKRAKNPDAIKGHVVHGTIYDEIMKAADRLGAGLIILGAHRPEFKDFLLGPNAARVVRHATQSVFVVRE